MSLIRSIGCVFSIVASLAMIPVPGTAQSVSGTTTTSGTVPSTGSLSLVQISGPRMSFQLENQALVLDVPSSSIWVTSWPFGPDYTGVVITNGQGSYFVPAITNHLWEISKDSGASWQIIGEGADDAALHGSGTENPLTISLLKTAMTGWQYRVTADYLQSGTTSVQTSAPITLNVKPSHIKSPRALAIDAANNLYVADTLTNAIWKIFDGNKTGVFAGSAAGEPGVANATGTNARFNRPQGIALHAGKLYVADTGNNAIRVIAPDGGVTLLAGAAGQAGDYKEGTGAAARFDKPTALTVDAGGNVYVIDSGNNIIRKITPAGVTSHVAGDRFIWGGALLTGGLVTDEINFHATATLALTTQGMTAGTTQDMLGRPVIGSVALAAGATVADGCTLAQSATFAVLEDGDFSGSIVIANGSTLLLRGNVYCNARTTPQAPWFDWQTSPQSLPYYFNTASGIALSSDGKSLYVANSGNDNVCKIDLASGDITCIDAAISALPSDGYADYMGGQFYRPRGIRFDKNNMLHVADAGSSRILKIASSGTGATVAGLTNWFTWPGAASSGLHLNSFNDGPVNEALFYEPSDIVIDSAGNIYVADTENAAIRKITPGGAGASVATLLLEAAPVQYPSGTTGTPPAGNPDSSGGGGGGGGALSAWFLLALGALATLRARWR